ncbi:MAG: PspC domain-containing protein [Gammaproteobacteria bacterium]|nr:PspC domain-containing protein [Gammaproteobacteria bacterium]MDH5630510.1 PspC domain-containing protein [Gammaproteobacteria bacterium]
MKSYHYYRRYEEGSGRPRAESKIMGVCAGIAHQFGWDVVTVRIIALLSLFILTGPTILAYLIAGVLFY